jgi:hypothetical protein
MSFKLFTKVGTNKITGIAPKVIRPTQTAFMPGHHILLRPPSTHAGKGCCRTTRGKVSVVKQRHHAPPLAAEHNE